MIKVGFIGFGSFAKLRLDILSGIKNVICVGYYDPGKCADKESLVKFNDVNSLLEAVDAVIISVPPFFAPGMVKTALKNKVHVFCEKPPGVNLESLSGIEELVNGLVLAYGFNHRLHGSIKKIKEIVDSSEMGRILWMRGRYGKEVSESYKLDWRCNKELNGGGILIDQGIHLLDIMDWLSGGFDVTQSILSDSYLGIDKVEDNAFISLLSTKTRVSASLHSTITQWRYLFSLEIFLEGGALVLNGLRTRSRKYGDEQLVVRHKDSRTIADKVFEYDRNESWSIEMCSFIESIMLNSEYPHTSLNEARNIMMLIDDIYNNALWVPRC